MKKFLLYIAAILSLILPASAQEKLVECRIIIDVPFCISGSEEKHIRYDIDSVGLVKSLQDLRFINDDINTTIKSVEFYSSVSPEGSLSFNRKLGKKRLKTVERLVRKYLEIPESVPVTYTERMIPWDEFLLPAIKADSTLAHREELIKVISNSPRKSRRSRLARARGGRLWKVVKTEYFGLMRKGGAIIILDRVTYEDMINDSTAQVFTDGVSQVEQSELYFPRPLHEPSEAEKAAAEAAARNKFNYGLSLKTNLIGLGLGISNIGIEADLAKHWSLAIPIYYSAWNYFSPTIKFRTLGVQPEVRYWFKENNTGLFLGAHLGVASYNIATDGLTRFQDHNGKSPAWGGGISVGYRMPLSKKHPNWKVEFTVGAGAYALYYDKFYNLEDGRLFDSRRRTYFGVDNAAINISYRFNLNKRKR